MVVLMAKYTVKQGQTEKVIELLHEMAGRVKQSEPECQVYKIHRPVDQSDVLVLYEVYKDTKALEAHREYEHFKEIIEGKVIPLLEKREREVYDLVIDVTQ